LKNTPCLYESDNNNGFPVLALEDLSHHCDNVLEAEKVIVFESFASNHI